MRSAFRHQDALIGYAYGILRDWALAEDAVQESLIVVQRKWEQFSPGSSMYAWVRQIVRYECLDARRTAQRLAPMEEQELTGLVDSAFEQYADDETAERVLERKAALRECMEKADERSRTLILRFYRDRWPFEKLAAWTGRSSSALRVNLLRIRRSLRDCIEKQLAVGGCGP